MIRCISKQRDNFLILTTYLTALFRRVNIHFMGFKVFIEEKIKSWGPLDSGTVLCLITNILMNLLVSS
jgi:hypothetical protein